MGIVNGIRTIDNILAGTLSGAQLETWLGTGINKSGFIQAINSRSQARVLVESNAAMAIVAASTIAMSVIGENSYALNLIFANSAALAIVVASSAAMTALSASVKAKTALFNSDVVLTAIASSSTALTAMRAASQYAVYATANTTGTRGITGLNASGFYIILGASTSDSSVSATLTIATRKSGSTRGNTNTTAADNVSLTTALGPIVMPMITPFTFGTTDGTYQIGYVGALRCDV